MEGRLTDCRARIRLNFRAPLGAKIIRPCLYRVSRWQSTRFFPECLPDGARSALSAACRLFRLPAAKGPMELDPWDALSIVKQVEPPLTGRKVAIVCQRRGRGGNRSAHRRGRVHGRDSTRRPAPPPAEVHGLKLEVRRSRQTVSLRDRPRCGSRRWPWCWYGPAAAKVTEDSAAV